MKELCPKCYDPYDLWTTKIGVFAKKHFYKGHIRGKLLSIAIGLIDWIFPILSRRLIKAKPLLYPITVAQWILSHDSFEDPESVLNQLMSTATPETDKYGCGWGLGFPWMSKNGLYPETMPFITHTPYAMEALLHIADVTEDKVVSKKAKSNFAQTWKFLNSLKVMHESEEHLVLSYAPMTEPRMVVNANSYAALCYALHAIHNKDVTQVALKKCQKLLRWVVDQQNNDGSWHYYADDLPGNFIDGFHTCFVIKNILKCYQALPNLDDKYLISAEKGTNYLNESFVDQKSGLLKRFAERDIKDPFVCDIYDQAEYLGVLVLNKKVNEANSFSKKVTDSFCKNGNWYCRKDIFGRYWGKEFNRWGIMPFVHQQHELKKLNEVNGR